MATLLRRSTRVDSGRARMPPPECPRCHARMSLRLASRGEYAGERYWACTRYPTCTGSRPLKARRAAPPAPRSETAQQRFERESAARRRPRIIHELVAPLRRTSSRVAGGAGQLAGLDTGGYIVLSERRAPRANELIHRLLVGPTGVYVVEFKSWPGQVAVDGERLYVDGRLRNRAVDEVLNAASAVQDALVGELKPLGVAVTPVLCFQNSDLPAFKRSLRGVLITGGRGLVRAIRGGPTVLDGEMALSVALAADDILLPAV